MNTQTVGLKRRGRPPKIKTALPPSMIDKAGSLKEKEVKSEFAQLVAPHKEDAIVKSFLKLRKQLFAAGQSVDQITGLTVKRCNELSVKGNIVH